MARCGARPARRGRGPDAQRRRGAQLHRRLSPQRFVQGRSAAALGSEAAGIVEAVGTGVDGFEPGMRVGTLGPSRGAYATARNVVATELIHLPDSVDDRTAAALLLKGATAAFLIERCAKVEAGQAVLVHAAAGGVGHLLVGWLKAIGAVVIGSVGSGRQGRTCQGRRCGSRHQPCARGCRETRSRDRVGGRPGGARRGGQGRRGPSPLACAARRGLIVSYGNARRGGRRGEPGHPRGERVAVRDSSDAVRLCDDPRGRSRRWSTGSSPCWRQARSLPTSAKRFALRDAARRTARWKRGRRTAAPC